MQVRKNGASLCSLGDKNRESGKARRTGNRKEANSRECQCCVVSPQVAFHCVSL